MYDERLDFDRLKALVSVGEVLSAYGLDAGLVRRGMRLRGCCPLHGGDNPTAFSVDDERGLWHCFTACGGGDVVDLVGRLERCSPQRAARHLARIAAAGGLASPAPQPVEAVRPRRFAPFGRRLCLDPRVPFVQDDKLALAAHEQGGIMSVAKLAELLQVRDSTLGSNLREIAVGCGIEAPSKGLIEDAGPHPDPQGRKRRPGPADLPARPLAACRLPPLPSLASAAAKHVGRRPSETASRQPSETSYEIRPSETASRKPSETSDEIAL